MFFSSLIAENANRRERLVFQTPQHVPAPQGAEPKLKRFPSWMANADDPFGPDSFTSTGNVLSPSVKSGASSESTGTFLGGEIAVNNFPREFVSNKAAEHTSDDDEVQLPSSMGRGYTLDSIASIDSGSGTQTPATTKGPSMAMPALPISAVFLSGGTALPMFSCLSSGVLVNRFSKAETMDGRAAEVSDVTSGGYEKEENMRGRVPMVRRISSKFAGLSKIKISQSPFDPFGNAAECPLHRSGKEYETGNESDEEASDGNFENEEGASDGDSEEIVSIEAQREGKRYWGRRSNSLRSKSESSKIGLNKKFTAPPRSHSLNNLQRPRSNIGLSSFHHTFVDSRRRLSTSHYSACSDDAIADDEKTEGHSTEVPEHVTTAQIPVIASDYESPNGMKPFDESSAPASNEQARLGRASSTRMRSAMMNKIRKLAHLKRT